MLLRDYCPKSALQTSTTRITEPRFPVIDAHNHLSGMFGGSWDQREVSALIDLLDQARVQVYVDLDGGWGEDILQQHLDHFKQAAPDRFVVFGGVDWDAWPQHGDHFADWAAGRLRLQKEWGAQGLKIWKPFGLSVRDDHSALVSVDDPRLDPIWHTAGELGLPVLIHIADPVAFFWDLNAQNERWEELQNHPDWHFPSPEYPAFETIVEALANLVARFPATTFIGAHVGCFAENLAWVGALMDRCSNFYVDIAARIAELGRQPYTARKFFLKYADRILFGTDMSPDLDYYRIYYRFLESDDEYFNYGKGEPPGSGRWRIYGLFLPDDVLKKVYFQNAERIILQTGG
jgi:predicted TIM-barrel fold metal-dependent hydrolase